MKIALRKKKCFKLSSLKEKKKQKKQKIHYFYYVHRALLYIQAKIKNNTHTELHLKLKIYKIGHHK